MALVYVTTTDIEYLTGTKLATATVLTGIGEQAEREVVSYLKAKGITTYSGDSIKTAVLKLAHAGVLARYYTESSLTKSDNAGTPGTTYQDFDKDPIGMIESLRKEAFTILDQYADTQTTSGSYSTLIRKVNGRCR